MSSAKAIKAGEAYVETYAKNERLREDLNKAASMTAKIGGEAGGKFSAKLAGAIGGPIGMIVAGVGAGVKIAMDEAIVPVREFARETERQAQLSAEAMKVFEKRIDKVRERLAAVSEQAATPGGIKQLGDETAKAQKELKGLEDSLNAAKKQMQSYDKAGSSKENLMLYITGGVGITDGLAGEQAKLKPLLDEANQKYKAQLDLLIELRQRKMELDDPTKSIKAMQEIGDFTRELREQLNVVKEITKETEEQTKLRKLTEKFGFKRGTAPYEAASKAVKDLNAGQAAKALTDFAKEVEDSTDRLVNDNREHEKLIELEKLAKDKGVTDSPELTKARKAVRDLNAAESVENAKEWGRDYDDLMQKIQKVTEGSQFLPAAVWGSFSGASGNLRSPENPLRSGIAGLLSEQSKTNGTLDKILDELRETKPWTL